VGLVFALRLAFVDKRCPKLPCDADLPAPDNSNYIAPSVIRPLWPSEQFAEKLLLSVRPCAWESRIYLPILMLFAIALCALDYRHPLLSLEAEHFEWVYRYFSCGSHVCPLGHTFPSARGVLECRKILTTLDYFPLRRAFGELHFAWDPIWRLGSGWGLELSRLVARQLETLETTQAQSGAREEQRKCRSSAGRYRKNHQGAERLRSEFAKDKPEGSDSQHKPAASRPTVRMILLPRVKPLQNGSPKPVPRP